MMRTRDLKDKARQETKKTERIEINLSSVII